MCDVEPGVTLGMVLLVNFCKKVDRENRSRCQHVNNESRSFLEFIEYFLVGQSQIGFCCLPANFEDFSRPYFLLSQGSGRDPKKEYL